MTYAKYISDTQIDTTIPKSGRDARGRPVIGNLENRPDVLKLLHYYPLVEEPYPSDQMEGRHWEKRYRVDYESEPQSPVAPENQSEPLPDEEDTGPVDAENPVDEEWTGDPEESPEPEDVGEAVQEIESEEPAPADPAGDPVVTVVQYWISVEDPPPPPEPTKVYSKLKILMAADQAGFADALMDMIESDRKVKYIWDASNTIEDNELLGQYLPMVGDAIGKTPEEMRAFLNQYCQAD